MIITLTYVGTYFSFDDNYFNMWW